MKMTDDELKKFEKQNKKLAELAQPVREFPELVAATKKMNDLQAKLKAVNERISDLSNKKGDVSQDAKIVLEGKPLAARPGTQEDLYREKTAVEKAVELQREVIYRLTLRIVAEGCEQISPIAKEYAKNLLDNLDAVEAAITNLHQFYTYLGQKGYQLGMRPGHWRPQPFECCLLTGGMNIEALYVYRGLRRRVWGIDAKAKK